MEKNIVRLAQMIQEREELEKQVISHYERVIKTQENIINDLKLKLAAYQTS